jgi:hypothetical protein
MFRRLIALDEMCVKVKGYRRLIADGLEYWVYAALDVDRNENYIHEGLSIKEWISSRAIHT